jgi:hypothetical protein
MSMASLELDFEGDWAASARSTEGERTSDTPRFRLVNTRDVEPTDASPLVYRERAYASVAGVETPVVEAFLLEQLAGLRASLAGGPRGQLVVLAAFDGLVDGRPRGGPRATLRWKDWRAEEAELERAGGEARLVPLARPAPAASTPRPKEAAAKRAPARRLSADDLIGELFEAMIDLQFEADAVAGAHFVLGLLRDKLRVEAAMVSLFDINRREFVVVAQGGGEGDAVLARVPQHAGLAAAAHRARRAVLVENAADDARVERLDRERWARLGVTPESLLCAPVAAGGRTLGLVELANPSDGAPFRDAEGNAAQYVAQQLAEFLADRGVVVDEDAIRQTRAERAA